MIRCLKQIPVWGWALALVVVPMATVARSGEIQLVSVALKSESGPPPHS